MDKKLETAKAIGSWIVSVGVGVIVGNIIGYTTPANTGKIGKACIWVGGTVITWMAKEEVTTYAEKKFDETVENVKSIIAKTKEITA